MTKIFVYGTLRRGMYNYDIYLREKSTYCYDGYIKGSLMKITDRIYPAFLYEGYDMIFGEVYEVDEETIEELNELEGYYGKGRQDNEYNLVLCDVYDDHQQKIDQAYIYEFNMDNPHNVNRLGDDILEHDYVLYIQKQPLSENSLFAPDDE